VTGPGRTLLAQENLRGTVLVFGDGSGQQRRIRMDASDAIFGCAALFGWHLVRIPERSRQFSLNHE
jgi:hypothetical protein